jgi:hypothetical protein
MRKTFLHDLWCICNWILQQTAIYVKNGVWLASPYKMKSLRRSDTLFILGSGYSINNIKNWDKIKKNDSFGFNFWLLHEFIPNFYFFEPPRDQENLHIMKKLIDLKIDKYRFVNFYVKSRMNSDLIESVLKKNFICYSIIKTIKLKAKTIDEFESKCILLKELNMDFKLFFYSHRVASIELLVMIGWLMGYSKIVLCGVDLNNNDYFYDHPSYNDFRKILLIPKKESAQTHRTNDPVRQRTKLPVSIILKTYQEVLLGDLCKIYVENEKSALSVSFPVYKLS